MTKPPRNPNARPAGPPEVGPPVPHTAVPGAEVTVDPGHVIAIAAGRRPAASQTLKALRGNGAARRTQWIRTGRNLTTMWRKPHT